jgi:hypothetical protein
MKDGRGEGSLRVVLTTPKSEVRFDEPITFEVKVFNTSDEKVSLFGELLWGYAGGLTLHVSDENGNPVEAEQHDDDMVVPSLLDNPFSYVVLFPNHFLGTQRRDTPKNLFRKPGSYRIFAEYLSPVPNHYAKTPNFRGRDDGPIRSATMVIEVRK